MSKALPIMTAALLLVAGASSGCARETDAGARVWKRRCAACHGADGSGRTRFAEGRPFADLTDGKWRHAPEKASIRRLVAEGDPRSTMPPFAATLSPEEIDAVVERVLAIAARTGGKAAR